MRVGFYAPMKSPDHPIPSGDRRVARLLMQALRHAGHDVMLMSELRVYDALGDAPAQQAQEAAAGAEVRRLIAEDARPALWFTYHNYYKSPDLLGPPLSAAWGIPYVIAEASHAPKREHGPWARWHRHALAASQAAAALFCFTALDRAMLSRLVPTDRLQDLPPFLDASPYLAANRAARMHLAAQLRLDPTAPWILAVAMMRERDKLASYRALAASLAEIEALPWQILIVGDGEARAAVEQAFAPLRGRVGFYGAANSEALPALYAAADLYAWPAVGEAFGMALLEAQAAGLPVVAGRVRGVPDVVEDGRSGLLADTPAEFTAALRRLLSEPDLRQRMGAAARAFVRERRDLPAAARKLDAVLRTLVAA